MKRFAPTIALMLAALHAEAAPVVENPAWKRHFDAQGAAGTFVLHDPRANVTRVLDEARARRRYLPASTFKIPNALIALETGVVKDPYEVFAWDGKPKFRDAWERDHTLATAMRESVVWVFQDIARRIGKPRMGEWLDRLDYGNRDMTGGIDQFWLQGGLRISALEQVEFLRKLEEGRLAVSARSRRIVREILVVERCGDTVIRAKTGNSGGQGAIAWWVGWVEKAGEPVAYFAINLDTGPKTPMAKRITIARGILEEAGVLPAVTADACAAG